MNKLTIRSVARWICAASLGITTAASAESVGANFLGRNAPTSLLPTERAGVVEQAFWNNVDDAAVSESGTSDPLRNDAGNFTAATVTFKGNDSWNSDGPSVTPNDRLMLGIIKQQGAGTTGNYSLNGLGAGPYDVILYTSMNGDGVVAEFSVGGTAKTIIEQHQFDGTFVEATDTTAGNYIRFNGVTPVDGKIAIGMKYISGADGAGLAGIQAIGTFSANTTPVSIVTQPKDSQVPVGSRGGFSVKANASNLNFQWYRDNSPIAGATSASYTTPITTAGDDGAKFKVKISNNVNEIFSDEVVLRALTPVLAKGFVTAEFYRDIGGGTAVADLQNADKYKAGTADENRLLAAIDSPNNYGDNYGAKVSGFITPPAGASGNYYFFIRSDDASAFYISSDDKVANLGADPIAFETGCCDAFKEPGAGDETSSAVELIAGKSYYFEALVKEGGGGDYLQVAIREENDTTAATALKPLSGDWIGTFVLPDSTITVVTAPAATSVTELSPATFTAAATANSATRGAVPVRYQWLKNGNPIPGATEATLKVTGSVLADSGTKYSVRIGAPGATDVTTEQVALTVTPDNVPPAIVSVAGVNSKNGVEVSVLVDEPLTEADSIKVSNFTLSTGTVTGARYIENSSGLDSRERAVVLSTTGLTPGSSYTLTVSGLKDVKGNVSTSVATPFTVSKLTWVDLARPSAFKQDVIATKDGFNVLNGGAAFWGTDDDATFVYEEVTGDFDKVLRIEGQDASSNWARAGLHARESLEAHAETASRYQQVHANPYPKKYDGTDSNQGFETNRRLATGAATSSSNGDNGVNHPQYPNAWVRLIRTGDIMHMYRSNDGVTWYSLGRSDFYPADGSGEAPLPAKMYVGIAFGSENGNITPETSQNSWIARFRNYGDFATTAPAGKQTYSIGVNFTDDNRDGALGPGDVAGAPAVAQKNWNNAYGTSNGDAPLAVKADEGGVAKTTTTTVEWTGAPNTWASTGRGEENNPLTGSDHLLMSGFLDTSNDSTTKITVSGVPSKLTSGKYDIVVYTLGGVASGRGGAFRVTDGDGNELKPYVYVLGAENPTAQTRVPTKESTPGDGATYATGTYVVFSGLSASTVIIEATTQIITVNGNDVDAGVGGTQRAPVNAIQLVGPTGLLDQVAVNPTISIQGSTVTFTGTLQSADTVSGPYTDVAGATSPFTIQANAASKFWRTRQ